MLITPETDLTPLVGVRVRVERQDPTTDRPRRAVYHGVFESLDHWHGDGRACCGGMFNEEPRVGYRGGRTGFALPYGDATVEPVEG